MYLNNTSATETVEMEGCPDLVAAVVGSICGTLIVCAIIFGIIITVMWRKMKRSRLKYVGE